MTPPRWFAVYVLPASVFQAVIFGGAYGTGREVVEFVTRYGAGGGLLALGLVAMVFILVLCLTFEFARQTEARDYRTFFRCLTGRGWIAYEVLLILMLIVVLGVNASAAELILTSVFHWPHGWTVTAFVGLTLSLVYAGHRAVESAMTVGAVMLGIALAVYAVLVLGGGSEGAEGGMAWDERAPNWPIGGLRFALYNVAAMPVLLYATEAIRTRREAIGAGVLTGLAGAVPALVLHLTFMDGVPLVVDAGFPVQVILERHDLSGFLTVYAGVLFVMVVLTAVGLLHGLNSQLQRWLPGTGAPHPRRWLRLILPVILVTVSLLLAEAGIIPLIARGYGTIAWGFLAVYLLPLLLWALLRRFRKV